MQKVIELFAYRGQHGLSTMPDVEAADAAGEVDVAVAVYIFEPRVFGFGHIHGSSKREPARHGGVAALGQRFGFRSRDLSFELNRVHVLPKFLCEFPAIVIADYAGSDRSTRRLSRFARRPHFAQDDSAPKSCCSVPADWGFV